MAKAKGKTSKQLELFSPKNDTYLLTPKQRQAVEATVGKGREFCEFILNQLDNQEDDFYFNALVRAPILDLILQIIPVLMVLDGVLTTHLVFLPPLSQDQAKRN